MTNEDGNVISDRNNVLAQGEVFDSALRENSDDPLETSVSGVVDGWTTALQHMHEGDIWEVWVPYQLGYGVSGYGDNIKPYTTLVFQVEVKEIVEQ